MSEPAKSTSNLADAPSAHAPPGAAEARAADMGTAKSKERFGQGGCRSVALGCGVFAAAVFIALIAVGIYLSFHWRSASASFITGRLTSAIQRTPLPLDQQQRIDTRIRDVGERFAAGQLTSAQMRYVGQQVFSDPLLTAGILYHAGDRLLQRSGLSADQQQRDRRSLQRFTHGVFTGSIPPPRVNAVAAPIRDSDDSALLQIKDHVTDAQLQKFVDLARQAADEAKVRDRGYKIDVAARFNKLVGEALRESARSIPKAEP